MASISTLPHTSFLQNMNIFKGDQSIWSRISICYYSVQIQWIVKPIFPQNLWWHLWSQWICVSFEIKINVRSLLVTSVANLNIPSIPLKIFEWFQVDPNPWDQFWAKSQSNLVWVAQWRQNPDLWQNIFWVMMI